MKGLVSSVLLTFLICGCVNRNGVAEFRLYTEAIDTLVTVSEPMADRLRAEEREAGLRNIDKFGNEVAGVNAGDPGDTGIAPDFEPEQAAYFSPTGDTPLAGAIRAAAFALKRYNDALLIYADGRGLDQAQSDLVAVSTDISFGLTALGATAKTGAAQAVVNEVVSAAGAVGSRAAFQNLLKKQGSALDELLGKLVDKFPKIYEALTGNDKDQLDDGIFDGGSKPEIVSRMKMKRSLVAEWVLLIRSARLLLADAILAIDGPGSISNNLATIAALSGDASIRAARIRALLAERN